MPQPEKSLDELVADIQQLIESMDQDLAALKPGRRQASSAAAHSGTQNAPAWTHTGTRVGSDHALSQEPAQDDAPTIARAVMLGIGQKRLV
jgi:hypothetical protein